MAEYFRVIVHHGGFFIAFPEKKYINGQEQVWEEIDPDRWSYFECVGCLKDMGYEKCEALWYKDPLASLKDGLELLRNDRDAAKMAKVGLEHGEVELYVVCCGSNDRDDKEVTDGEWSYSEGELESSEDSAFEEDFCDSEDGEDDEGYFEVPIRNDDDILLRDLINKKRRRGNDSKGKESKRSGKVISTSMVICQEGEESETDSLKSMGSGDEDCETGKPFHQTFKMPLSMVDYKWHIGTLFATKDQFKDAIRTYSVHNGKNLKFKRNDNYRIFVNCKEGCEWFAKAYKLKNEDTWQLKQLLDKHSCNREYKVKMMNSKWLSKNLQDCIRENPSMKLVEITSKVHRKWNIGITRYKAGRARSNASELVSGSFSDQYLRLYDYCHELLRSNPGSTVRLKVDRPPDVACVMIELEALTSHTEVPRTLLPTFERMYVCLNPVKQSFLRCRPIIGLDGCFLKTPYGGEVLSAVGRDPNDQMLPLAYAVVEGENKESWTWFLTLLIEDLGGVGAAKLYTFICDQQKGLLPAFDDLLPGVDQRFCVRHLYNNFKKRHPGKQLKDLMWTAVRASYPSAWEKAMLQIKEVNMYLIKIPPRFWSKSRFRFQPKCDTLLNNMSETFNSVIVEARQKPILIMMEEIRVYLMERWADNRYKGQNLKDGVLPRIRMKLEREKKLTNMWIPRLAGDQMYEVRHVNLIGDRFVVNLISRECSCRRWMLTGIPCCHAICCMNYQNQNIEDHIPIYYRKETYEACYAGIILPMNGPSLWEKTPFDDILPPPIRKQPGRPKKSRRKEKDEEPKSQNKMSKKGMIVKCSVCGQRGHNKKSCSQAIPPPIATTPQTSQAIPPPASQAIPAQTSQPILTQSSQFIPPQTQRRMKLTPTRGPASRPKETQPVQATSSGQVISQGPSHNNAKGSDEPKSPMTRSKAKANSLDLPKAPMTRSKSITTRSETQGPTTKRRPATSRSVTSAKPP